MIWSKQKVLVTGGAGFIGKNLVKELLRQKVDVTVIDNFLYGPRENILVGCNLIEGDVRDESIFKKIPENINYIFHFAAPSSIILFKDNPKNCIDITVNGFRNVLNWGIKSNVKKIIYPSSGSVYGLCPIPQSESNKAQPVNIYGKTKLVCEALAEAYSEFVSTIGLRIFAGYGIGEEHKGDFASVITLFLNSILKGESPEIYGDGMQSRDFVYIDDIVEAILRVAESENISGIINVGSGMSFSFNKIVNIINQILGKEVKPNYVKKPVNYLENTLADIDNMKKLLKKNPLPLKDGLSKYINLKLRNKC